MIIIAFIAIFFFVCLILGFGWVAWTFDTILTERKKAEKRQAHADATERE